MGKTWAIASGSGGVGKTTIALALAVRHCRGICAADGLLDLHNACGRHAAVAAACEIAWA